MRGVLFLALSLFSSAVFAADLRGSVLTICLAESRADGGPCQLGRAIGPELGTWSRVDVPLGEMNPEGFRRVVDAALAKRADEFLIVHVAGTGMTTPAGWRMDWLDAEGRPRATNPLAATVIRRAIHESVELSAVKKASFIIDGTLLGGVPYRHDSLDPSEEIFYTTKAVGDGGTYLADGAVSQVNFALRMHLEEASAAISNGKPDPFNRDIDDVDYLPFSAKAEPACREFWKSVLDHDLMAVVQGRFDGLPVGRACRKVPDVLSDTHEHYLRCTDSARRAPVDGVDASPSLGCQQIFAEYRAALRRWTMRSVKIADVSDSLVLAELYLWADGMFPMGKYEARKRISLEIIERLAILKPGRAHILQAGLNSALDVINKDHPNNPAPPGSWERAERYADQLRTVQKSGDGSRGMGTAIYAKSHGLEPTRLRTVAREMLKQGDQPALANYLLAYAAHEENKNTEANRYLAEALKADPEMRSANRAKYGGAWEGTAVSESIDDIAFLKDAGSP